MIKSSIYDTPLVTVGIPVYNDENYIKIAIEDIINQSYTNLEIIISDNCSTDNTTNICDEYARKDNRIKYIRQPYNIGPQANFKFVLDVSSGEYFMWAASDDRWDPEFIEILMMHHKLDPSLSVVFCPYEEINEYGDILQGKYVFDFGGQFVICRIVKFNMELSSRSDAFFYGLFNKSKIKKIRFVQWWGINRNVPMNCAYPVLSYILACGNYYIVKSSKSLWFNRVYSNSEQRHLKIFINRPLRSYFAFILRKINQLYETEISIFRATSSIYISILLLPTLLIRFLFDCYQETVRFLYSIRNLYFKSRYKI